MSLMAILYSTQSSWYSAKHPSFFLGYGPKMVQSLTTITTRFREPHTGFVQTVKYCFPGLAKTKFQGFPGLTKLVFNDFPG